MNSTISSKDTKKAWEAFTHGEVSSFKIIFEGYYTSMFGYGLKLCSQPELVKDCIQDLFRTIWERRDDLTHITSPNVYLFVSLRRKIIKQLQSNWQNNVSLKELDEQTIIRFNREEIIIRDEIKFQQKRKLLQALNQLPNRQKEVMYLHFYNGMSYNEIEGILSINRQSVRNHVYRAMEALRSLLDNEIMKLVISVLITFFFAFSQFM